MSASGSDSKPEIRPATSAGADSAASEFLSEASAEFRALRRGQTADVAPTAAPAHTQRPVVTRPVTGPTAVERPHRPSLPVAVAPPAMPAPTASLAIASRAQRRAVPWSWLVVTIAIAVGATAWGLMGLTQAPVVTSPDVAGSSLGAASITSRPAGAEVWIGGVKRGVTPLQLNLPVGTHEVELRNGSARRMLPLVILANVAVRESIDLPPGSGLGTLEISTDTPGARVSIDGVARGTTPLVLSDLAPGDHTVTLVAGAATVHRTVRVAGGGTASVVVSMAPGGSTGGFLSVKAPFEMQVLERGRIVGTTSADQLMLPAGTRQLELVAEAYEFRTSVAATIQPGRTTTIPVSVPNGRLSINAVPWADVWLDGVALGATPLANITVSTGPHELVWRHPTLGERRETVRVGTKTPARASVTFPAGR